MVELTQTVQAPRAILETEGVLIPLEPSIITPAIESAISAGRFEQEEARELPLIVDYGDKVLEIGAGIGFISTLLARMQKVSKVIAYEANPGLMPFMADLHDLNGVNRIDRRNAVLTNDGDASKTFYLRHDFWMGSLAEGPNPYSATVEVPTDPLNDVLRDEEITLLRLICKAQSSLTLSQGVSSRLLWRRGIALRPQHGCLPGAQDCSPTARGAKTCRASTKMLPQNSDVIGSRRFPNIYNT